MKFGDPVQTDSERELRRDQKRRAAAQVRTVFRRTVMLLIGAVGAAVLLWQTTTERPTYALVAVGFALAVPGLVAIVEAVRGRTDRAF